MNRRNTLEGEPIIENVSTYLWESYTSSDGGSMLLLDSCSDEGIEWYSDVSPPVVTLTGPSKELGLFWNKNKQF